MRPPQGTSSMREALRRTKQEDIFGRPRLGQSRPCPLTLDVEAGSRVERRLLRLVHSVLIEENESIGSHLAPAKSRILTEWGTNS